MREFINSDTGEIIKDMVTLLDYEDDIFLSVVKENLKPEMEVKNYKELCGKLNFNVTGGNTKKANLKNLKRFCDYTIEGQKFYIKEIYDEPKPKVDKRSLGNNTIYVKLFETILLDLFAQRNQRTLVLTKKQLWEELGMINKSYYENYNNDKLLNELSVYDKDVKKWNIDKAYFDSRNKLNDITESAMKSLERRMLIKYNPKTIIAKRGFDYHEITQNWQIEEILVCEKEALAELGCSSMAGVFLSTREGVNYKEYTKIRDQKIKIRLGFDCIYYRHKIVCNRKYIKEGLNKNIDYLKKKLNESIIAALGTQAEKDLNKNRLNLSQGKTEFKYPYYYVDIQKLIFSRILNIDENIINDLSLFIDMGEEIDDVDEEIILKIDAILGKQ